MRVPNIELHRVPLMLQPAFLSPLVKGLSLALLSVAVEGCEAARETGGSVSDPVEPGQAARTYREALARTGELGRARRFWELTGMFRRGAEGNPATGDGTVYWEEQWFRKVAERLNEAIAARAIEEWESPSTSEVRDFIKGARDAFDEVNLEMMLKPGTDESRSQLGASEFEVVEYLSMIREAQEHYALLGLIDCDGDGRGEFASLIELRRAWGVRSHMVADEDGEGPGCDFETVNAWLPESDLDPMGLEFLDPAGGMRSSGYKISCFLPSTGTPGEWVYPELRDGRMVVSGRTGRIGIERSSRMWCAYAVPLKWGDGRRRIFFANQDGMRVCDNMGRRDATTGIDPFAAFLERNLDAGLATDEVGVDGEKWSVIK